MNLIAPRRLMALIGFLSLVACGDSKKPPLLGERIAVLNPVNALMADPALAQTAVELPNPQLHAAWPQAGAFPDHVRHHLALGENVSQAWSLTIGSGSSRQSSLQSLPIVADDKIFTVDSAGYVSAYAVRNGSLLWRAPTLPPEEEDPTISGALATAEGKLYVATAAAELVALETATGKEVWRKPLPAPVRVAPTIAGNRIFVITLDNQTIALSLEDGRRLWNHGGIGEIAGLLGGGAPAVSGDTVIVPYSSGELFALHAENGHVLWADNLSGLRQADAVASLANIRGNPVIDRGIVFAASHAGRLAAIELRTGERIWERELSVDQDPWVAGDYVFIVTTRGEVAALTRTGGHVRWVHALPRFADETEPKDPIRWSGPVLAGERLLLTGTQGKIAGISPYTGQFLGETDLPGSAALPPIVVGNTLYVLTEAGRLAAYR